MQHPDVKLTMAPLGANLHNFKKTDITPLVYIKQGLQFEIFGKKLMTEYEQKVLDLLELSIKDFFCFKNYN